MNILVLGGTRFMGRHLVTELLSKGHFVTIATRGLAEDDYGDRVCRICLDRSRLDCIEEALAGQSFDVIFDSLAYCSNDVKNLLDTVKCGRYIEISSLSVYDVLHDDLREHEFDAGKKELVYCTKDDFAYNQIKQQAECAIVQDYPHVPSVRVRFPFVIGEDDYTNRLYFYVEHIIKQVPMYIDNFESQMAFVHSNEAGKFLACFAENDFCGAINGASKGTISIKEVAEYVKMKTGKEIMISENGEKAPYNSADQYSLNLDKSKQLGFLFTTLDEWIFGLLDRYIVRAECREG